MISNPDSWRAGHLMEFETQRLDRAKLLEQLAVRSENFYASKSEGSKWAISNLCAYAGEAGFQGRGWRHKSFHGFPK